jgi:hypothetical protein
MTGLEHVEFPRFFDIDCTRGEIEGAVDAVWENCSPQDIADLAAALAAEPGAQEDCPVVQGGGPGALAGAELTLYEFLAFCDTVHDFGRPFKDRLACLHEWYPAPMLSVPDPNTRKFRPIRVMEIKREDVLLKYLRLPQYLRFPGHPPLLNPFRGVNILKRYPYDPARAIDKQARCARQGVRRSSRVVSMELWLEEPQPRLLQITQIANACATIRAALGAEVEWIVDASHEVIPSIMTSFPIVHERLLNKFRTAPSDRDEFVSELNAASLKWTPVICDASLNDPGDLDRYVYEKSGRRIGFDRDPTGPIYRDDYPDQVTLRGAVHKKNNDMCYDTEEFGEINHRYQQHSLPAMTRRIKDTLADERAGILTHDMAMARISRSLALKRSGDWGQVENCVAKGRALMTCDKMAALFAVYRGVSVVYVQAVQHDGVLQVTLTLIKGRVATDRAQTGGSNVRRHWYSRKHVLSTALA